MTPSSIPLALLAGGLATRLQPATKFIPKAMIDVGGQPFISHQLNLLRREGVKEVVLCTGHLGEQIKDFVKNGNSFDLKVEYSFDGDQLLGTGGALKKALPFLDENFWVMYGDSYLDTSFPPVLEYFYQHEFPALMTVLYNDNQWDKSNVLFQDGRILSYDKKMPSQGMKHIDYGLGILNERTLNDWKDNQVFDMAEVYRKCASQGILLGYEVKKRFYEIGSPEGLAEAKNYLKR